MDEKDLSKLPRALRLDQMGQKNRRQRVTRQEHNERTEALDNLTNKILTPRKGAKKDEKLTPLKTMQAVHTSTPKHSPS